MPREVEPHIKAEAVDLIRQDLSQRQISQITGLSRGYLRDLADSLGYQFPRNGHEVKGQLCMCAGCGSLFRRPPSRVDRVARTYCSPECKTLEVAGNKKAKSFSSWLMTQTDYQQWREAVMRRDGHRCQVTGLTEADGVNLACHHILPKGVEDYHHLSLSVDNGILICEEAHLLIHKLIREGFGYEGAVEEAKKRLSVGRPGADR